MNITGSSSPTFAKTAITNAGFSDSVLQKSLNHSMDTSFKNLYQFQRDMVGYYRYNFTSSNIVMSGTTMSISIPRDLIDSSRRDQYRISNYYNRELTLDEISANRTLFVSIPLLFIDGQSSFAYKVKVSNDTTELILNLSRTIMTEQHDLTVLFIGNNGLVEIKSNKYVLDKYGNDLPTSLFGTRVIDEQGTNFAFVSGDGEMTGSSFNVVTDGRSSSLFNMTTFTNQIIQSNESLSIRVFNFRFIYSTEKTYVVKKKADNSLACELCVINTPFGDRYDMPIPTENLIILKYDAAKNDFVVNNKVSAVLHYPNIYEIIDSTMVLGDQYKVFFFYYTNQISAEKSMQINQSLFPWEDNRWGIYNNNFQGTFSLISKSEDWIKTGAKFKFAERSNTATGGWQIGFYNTKLRTFDTSKKHTLSFYLKISNVADISIMLIKGDWTQRVSPTIVLSSSQYSDWKKVTFEFTPLTSSASSDIWMYMTASNAIAEFMVANPSLVVESSDLKDENTLYTNKLSTYHKFIEKKQTVTNFEEAINNIYFGALNPATNPYLNLFETYFNMVEPEFVFNNDNFAATSKPNYFDYKVNKFKEFISKDVELLTHYQKLHNKNARRYSFYASNMDWNTRVRDDNHIEITNKNQWVSFSEKHYVFMFPNDNLFFLNMHIYIDGVLCTTTKMFRQEDLEVYYVPKRCVGATSLIEFERFENFNFTQTFRLGVGGYKTINLYVDNEPDIQPLVSDIYVVDKETQKRIDKNKLQFSVVVNDIRFPLSGHDKITSFDVAILDSSLMYDDLTLFIQKIGQTKTFISDKDGYARVLLTEDCFNPERSYFRVFKNGRLLPPNNWALDLDKNVRELKVLSKVLVGDSITIDITPYFYTDVYTSKTVPTTPYFDLYGIIDKPFNLQYYDVYVNGRKLNETNVFAITPTKIVFKNLKSLKNLSIYQKDRDQEYFNINGSGVYKKTVLDELLENTDDITPEDKLILINHRLDELKADDVISLDPNVDIENDIQYGILISDEDIDMNDFYEFELKPLAYLNPDYVQFNYYDIMAKYPDVAQWMVSDSNAVTNPNVLRFNPDANRNAPIILRVGDSR